MNDLPIEVTRVIDAVNNGDTEAFLDAFTSAGEVDDVGRIFSGRDRICQWSDAEAIGKQTTFEVKDATSAGNQVTINLEVAGNGYNGPAMFVFTIEGDLISKIVIS